MVKNIILIVAVLIILNQSTSAQETYVVRDSNDNLIEYKVTIDTSVANIKKAFFNDNPSQLAYEEHYVKGKKNGRNLYYFPNGEYYETYAYGYGDRHGDYARYNRTGRIIIKGKYKNDLQHGYWIDKRVVLIGRFKKGLRHSKWKIQTKDHKEYWVFKKGKLKIGDANSLFKLSSLGL